MIDMEVWKPHQIRPGECLEAQVGPVPDWLGKSGDEIHIATRHQDEGERQSKASVLRVASEPEPAGLDWGRLVCGDVTQVGSTMGVILEIDMLSVKLKRELWPGSFSRR